MTYEDLAYHQHCSSCGKDVIVLRDFLVGYDPQTGDPVMHSIAACLDWRWWRLNHFREEFNSKGKMVIRYDY